MRTKTIKTPLMTRQSASSALSARDRKTKFWEILTSRGSYYFSQISQISQIIAQSANFGRGYFYSKEPRNQGNNIPKFPDSLDNKLTLGDMLKRRKNLDK
jgi:hypothetical protein